jgi:RNA polymerase sigma factor (sigma-70 family)
MPRYPPGAAPRARAADTGPATGPSLTATYQLAPCDEAERAPPDASQAASGVVSGAAEASLDALYRRYARWLREVLRRRFGRDAAEDLVQDAFSRVAASPPREGMHRPQALLLRIAQNAAGEARRRAAVRAPDFLGTRVDVEDVHAAVAAEQAHALLLKQVIAELPLRLRDVFILSRFEGLTYPEIAQRLGISIKTVEWRMSKALDICAARVRD